MPQVALSGEAFTVAGGYDKFWRKATAGRWEPSTFEVIRRCVDAETVVLDIGAWIGPTVLFSARRAKRVEAFEPDPASVAVLRENLALNPADEAKVSVHEAAVWTEAGARPMGNQAAPGDSTSSLLEPDAAHQWTVNCIAAADLAEMVDPREKLFVKIDVEGAEYELLPALGPILQRPRVDVLIAFHPHVVERRRPRFARTRAMTRDAFAPFEAFSAHAVPRRGIRPSFGAWLGRTAGVWAFEAKDNYLFRRRV